MKRMGWVWGSAIAVLSTGWMPAAAIAAEEIIVSLGALQRSISIESLEIYAQEGRVEADLKPYLNYLEPKQRDQLRKLLATPVEVDTVAVSQFLYTQQGEALLEQAGEIIQTEAFNSGFFALRGALILAADSEAGLTPLSVLHQFPSVSMRIDIDRTLQLISEFEQLVNQTATAIAAIEAQSNLERETQTSDFSDFPDLRLPGSYRWQKETLTLVDADRDRVVVADLYLPQTDASVPVIVISHGLGSDRASFAYLAEHLASYGFAVAVPEHPGSNARQLRALITGRVNDVTRPEEFVNRPLDIQFLLDELEHLTQSNSRLQGRLNLQQVGVVGQSLGGYTALTLAGADLNFRQLSTDCLSDGNALNLSLLLQCEMLEANYPTIDFQDDRVKAVIAVNPIGRSALGNEGFANIDRPLMIVTSAADTIAPALLEQIQPFTWLDVPDRYLLLLRRATHFSTIGATESEVTLPIEFVGSDPAIARRYIRAMSIAFFATHVLDQEGYAPYLQSAYANQISQPALPLRLITALTANDLQRTLANADNPSSENVIDF